MASVFKTTLRSGKKSRHWYGKVRHSSGQHRRHKLSTDKRASETMLANLQRDVELRAAGIVTTFTDNARVSVASHLQDYYTSIAAELQPKSLAVKKSMLNRLAEKAGWKTLADVTPESVENCLAEFGSTTSYRRDFVKHAKAFSRWLEKRGRVAVSPLRNATRPTMKNAVRTRARRAATPAELATLLTMPLPPYRRLCYALAAMNGLRRNEIRELRRGDLDLTAEIPIVTLPKKASAGSDTIPVHPFVVRLLQEQSLAMPGMNAVPFVPDVDTLKNDLAAAGIAFVNERGERLDMHALRHTFRTNLDRVKASRVTVKRLMRHAASDVTDNYAHADLSELADALSRLPSPDSINRAGTGAVATGTGLPLSTCDQHSSGGPRGGPKSRPNLGRSLQISDQLRLQGGSGRANLNNRQLSGQVKRMTGFPGNSHASPVPSLPVESLVLTLFAIRPSTQVV